MSHQEQAEQLYEEVGGCCSADHIQHWCEKCQNKIYLIRAALDAAAREALIQAANDTKKLSIGGLARIHVRHWLLARADALSGRHEEETKTKS